MSGYNAPPNLNPIQQTSVIRLPPTGTATDVPDALSLSIYQNDAEFVSASSNLVSFVFNQFGGNILDIELQTQNVYSAHERAAIEFNSILSLHQAKNSLGSYLGSATGSFDADGNLIVEEGSPLSGALDPLLTYPKFSLTYAKNIQEGFANYVHFGQNISIYSASIDVVTGQQDYDFRDIIYSASLEQYSPFSGALTPTSVVSITKVYYKSPSAMWRFFGFFGGLNIVGNLNSYGQYADDSSFQIVPVWQNKLQNIMFKDHLWTRASHYSYKIHDNFIRFYPSPQESLRSKIWVEFAIEDNLKNSSVVGPNAPEGGQNNLYGVGVNNFNTLPFSYIPFSKINNIGRTWIRMYALAVCKEILGNVRGKFSPVPIIGGDSTLNSQALLSQAKDEMNALREELLGQLEELTYAAVIEREAGIVDNNNTIVANGPLPIYIG